MKIRHKIAKWMLSEYKAIPDSGAGVVLPSWNDEQLQSRLTDFVTYVTEGFRKNPVLYSCITARSDAVKEPPLLVWDRQEDGTLIPAKNHALRDLLKNPNPFMSEEDLLERVENHQDIDGNAYIFKQRNNAGVPVELWVLNPNEVEVRADTDRFIKAYYITHLGDEVPPSDIIHFKFQDPLNHFYGISPILATAQTIDTSNDMGNYIRYILTNMGVTASLFSTKDRLEEDVFDNFKDRMTDAFTGFLNAGKPLVLDGDTKYTRIAMGLDELHFGELQDQIDITICMAYKVPAMLVGVKGGLDRATYSNFAEARKHLYDETIQPLWKSIAGKIEHSFMNEVGNVQVKENQTLAFDLNKVDALREDIDKLYDRQEKASDILTLDQRRAIINEPPLPNNDGEVILVPLNLVPLGSGGISALTNDEKSLKPGILTKQQDIEVIREVMDTFIDRMLQVFTPSVFKDAQDMFEFIASKYREVLDETGWKQFKKQASPETIEKILKSVNAQIENTVSNFIAFEQIVKEGGGVTAGLFDLSFDAEAPEVMDFLNTYKFKFAKKINDTSVKEVRRVITKAIDEGLSARDTRVLLENEFKSWTRFRATKVARSEIIRASNAGSLSVYEQAGVKTVMWLTAQDERVCPWCEPLEGETKTIRDPWFEFGDTYTVEVENAKGDLVDRTLPIDYEEILHPPLHVQCLTGDSLITPRGNITAVSKRRYNGKVLRIETASNRVVTCTPNHPIFTDRGFVAANRLNIGGSVISDGISQGELFSDWKDKNKPTTIKEVVDSFLVSPDMVTKEVPMSAPDFHGDGVGSKVAIIATNGLLMNCFDIALKKYISKDDFSFGKVKRFLLDSLSSFTFSVPTDRASFSRLVSFLDLRISLFLRHLRPFDNLSLASGSDMNIGLLQYPSDTISAVSKMDSNSVLRPSRSVKGNHLKGDFFTDLITHVDLLDFDDFVYNIETTKSYYIANGITSHNCRCTLVPA